jgi:hypothetical protein
MAQLGWAVLHDQDFVREAGEGRGKHCGLLALCAVRGRRAAVAPGLDECPERGAGKGANLGEGGVDGDVLHTVDKRAQMVRRRPACGRDCR